MAGKGGNMIIQSQETAEAKTAAERRALLKKLGRFAAVTAPTVTLLLAATAKPKKALAVSAAPSSRQLKTTGESIDTGAIPGGVAGLSVERWRYQTETGLDQGEHIGAYAEEFQAAFGIGDGVTISTTDGVGVCLAAIKALSAKVESLDADLQDWRRKRVA
jgi:hypothetical protein